MTFSPALAIRCFLYRFAIAVFTANILLVVVIVIVIVIRTIVVGIR
jgi:hypothetical protein